MNIHYYIPSSEEEMKKLLIVWKTHIQPIFFRQNNLSQIKWNVSNIYKIYKLFKKQQKLDWIFFLDKNQVGYNRLVGMCIVAKNYRCYCVKSYDINKFIWYIFKNPNINTKGLLKHFLQNYFDKNEYIWLHADPSGGNKLLQYYFYNGFVICPCKKDQKVSLSRKFDGRYLYKII